MLTTLIDLGLAVLVLAGLLALLCAWGRWIDARYQTDTDDERRDGR